MSRFKTRRDFISKSITLSLGVGLTKMSVLEEAMRNHPVNQLPRDEMKSLIENSPRIATGKGDTFKEGCCAFDDAEGMKCTDKK